MLALFGATALLGLAFGFRSTTFLIAEVVLIATLLIGDRLITANVDRRIRGNDGERKVGAILEELSSTGWRTLHDVSLGRGNIDHILIGPAGLITVETKSHAGRIKVAKIDQKWLSQAYAQRRLIETITGEKVECMLVFSRAYLDPPVSRQRGVLVLPARMIAGHLERRKAKLSPEQVDEIHERLAGALTAGVSA